MTLEKLIEHMEKREKELRPTLVRKKEQIKGMVALLEELDMRLNVFVLARTLRKKCALCSLICFKT